MEDETIPGNTMSPLVPMGGKSARPSRGALLGAIALLWIGALLASSQTGALAAPAQAAPLSAAGGTPSSQRSSSGNGPARSRPHSGGHTRRSASAALATWFGPGLFGRHTACGQVLTHRLVGVASRTLPCGTLIRVRYKGRHLVLPVLDRGPYGGHARWDLTQRAAKLLRITETVRVHTRIVGHLTNSSTLGTLAPPPHAAASEPTGPAGGVEAD